MGVIELVRVHDRDGAPDRPGFLVERLWPRGVRRSGEEWEPLRNAAVAGDVTLLYSSRDTEHDNAVARREYLLARVAPAGSG